MDLQRYLRAIRKSWWLIAALVIAGGAVSFGYSKSQTPIYQSKLTFYVGSPDISGSSANSTNQFATDRATSYAMLLSSDKLAQLVAQAPGVRGTSSQISSKITGTAQLNTVLIDVVVRDTSAEQAHTIAAAVGNAFPQMVDGLDNGTGSGSSSAATVKLTVVSGPTSSNVPVSPRTRLNVLIGIVVGLLLGLVLAAIRELFDTSVRTADALGELSETPVLGTVGFDRGTRSQPLLIDTIAYSARAESMRQIRTNLQFTDAAEKARVVVVTSSVAGEGKSTISANLALALADSGERVVLIEGDLRRPRLSALLNVEGSIGLTNVLAGQLDLDDALQPWGDKGLVLLPSGTRPPNPAELLGGDGMKALLAELADRFDLVLIDTPPLLPVTDSAVLAANADGAIVVFRSGRTRRTQLRTALKSLEGVHARVLGCVLNMKPVGRFEKSSYASYYGSDGPVAERSPLGERFARLRRKSSDSHLHAPSAETYQALRDEAAHVATEVVELPPVDEAQPVATGGDRVGAHRPPASVDGDVDDDVHGDVHDDVHDDVNEDSELFDDLADDDSEHDDSAHDDSEHDEAVPDETVSDETVPDETVPEAALSDGTDLVDGDEPAPADTSVEADTPQPALAEQTELAPDDEPVVTENPDGPPEVAQDAEAVDRHDTDAADRDSEPVTPNGAPVGDRNRGQRSSANGRRTRTNNGPTARTRTRNRGK